MVNDSLAGEIFFIFYLIKNFLKKRDLFLAENDLSLPNSHKNNFK